VPLPKDVQLTDDAENEDPSGGTRRAGRKAKAVSEVTSTPPASKKVKTEDTDMVMYTFQIRA